MNEMSTLGPLSERTGGVAVGSIQQAPLFADRVATGLTHWYAIGYPKPAGSGRSVRVPVRSLALVPDGPDVRGAISVYSVSAGPDGETSDVSRERHEVRVPAASAGEASVVVLGFELAVETSSAAARISICVRDETSGDAGFRLIRPGS